MKLFFKYCLCLLLISTEKLLAEEQNDTPVFSVNLSLGVDSDNDKNQHFHFFLELPGQHQLSMGYGKSISNIELLNTTQQFISIATNPYETFSIGVDYSFWGKEKSLETRSLRNDLYLNLDYWSFSLSPQLNVVTFYGLNGTSKFDLYARAATVTATYYGFENLFLGVDYYNNRFADDPFFFENQVPVSVVAQRLSTSAQLLMTSLERYRGGISVGYFFSWGSMELDWNQSNAWFINSRSYTTSLIIDYQLNKNLAFNLILSNQRSKADADLVSNDLNSLDIGMSIYW